MARYYAEQALGMLETVGMVPAIEACDKMLKAAEVELISYENVGSTLVTMFVKGDVAAVKSSVKAGVEAAEKDRQGDGPRYDPAPDPSDRRCGVDLRRRCAMQRARGSIHIAGARFARNLRHRLLHPRSQTPCARLRMWSWWDSRTRRPVISRRSSRAMSAPARRQLLPV